VSFDTFLQDFSGRPLAAAEERAVRDLVEPHIGRVGDGWVNVVTGDGGADLYGYGDGHIEGFMVNHTQGREIWDLVFCVAAAAGFAVLPVGCGTLLPPGFDRRALPDDVPGPVLEIASGPDIAAAIERA
jgi:hypothetical protein